ncbi:MAG TPA: hypothetical protein VF050_09445 [Moraxellaceae bacterium]
MSLFRVWIALPLLGLAACQSNPPAPGDISQYICPNGLTARVSLNADKSALRLTLQGRSRTLRWDEHVKAYSNGKMAATVDDLFLRLEAPGLRQNCPLQIPAANKAATLVTPDHQ